VACYSAASSEPLQPNVAERSHVLRAVEPDAQATQTNALECERPRTDRRCPPCDRSCGPRLAERSSTPSPDIYNEFQTQD
jgi:hypothetical protein